MSAPAPKSVLMPVVPDINTTSPASGQVIGNIADAGKFSMIAIGPRSEVPALIVKSASADYVVSVGCPLYGPIEGPLTVRSLNPIDFKVGVPTVFAAPNLNLQPPKAELMLHYECSGDFKGKHEVSTKRAPTRRVGKLTDSLHGDEFFANTTTYYPIVGIFTAGRQRSRFIVDLPNGGGALNTIDPTKIAISVFAYSTFRPAKDDSAFLISAAGPFDERGTPESIGRRLVLDSSGNVELSMPAADGRTLHWAAGVSDSDALGTNGGHMRLSVSVEGEEADYMVCCARATAAFGGIAGPFDLRCYATSYDD